MKSIPKTERILNVISFLLKERTPVPWRVIRDAVDGYRDPSESDRVALRRFERDKGAIRDLGVTIEYTNDDGYGQSGYFIEPKGYFLPRIELSPEEAAMLTMAARATPASGELEAAMNSALSKIEFDSPIPGEIRSTVEEKHLFYHGVVEDDPEEARRFEDLSSAALNNKTVVFQYFSSADEAPAERKVDPYGLAFWSGRWYLVGLCRGSGGLRVYRFDRISGQIKTVNPGDEPDFETPPDFDVEEHVGKPPWRLRSVERMTVAIRFDPEISWMVKEQSGESDKWKMAPDGADVLERVVTDPPALIRWLLRFGPRAEIVSPLELRERMAGYVADIRALYDN